MSHESNNRKYNKTCEDTGATIDERYSYTVPERIDMYELKQSYEILWGEKILLFTFFHHTFM